MIAEFTVPRRITAASLYETHSACGGLSASGIVVVSGSGWTTTGTGPVSCSSSVEALIARTPFTTPRSLSFARKAASTAILALLTERTIGRAAAKCGLSEKTLRRWMAEDEEFKRDLADARRTTFQTAMHRVRALTVDAVETLALLMGPGTPPAVRLGAARTIAELAIHQHDTDTIMRKLDEIEAYQRQQDVYRRP